jgi:hypothetical protein
LHMTGPKPADGPKGLKQYDPEAFSLFDDFYSGRIQIDRVIPHHRGWMDDDDDATITATNGPAGGQKLK